MDNLVRAFTTRQPAVGSNGTTLQRNITIYVLVAGIAGGLLLVLAILLLCKYCSRTRSRPDATDGANGSTLAGASRTAPAKSTGASSHLAGNNSSPDGGYLNDSPDSAINYSIRTPEVSVALSSGSVKNQQPQQRIPVNSSNNKATSPTLATTPQLPSQQQQPQQPPPPSTSSSSGAQQPGGGMETCNASNMDDHPSDSYVIQVEPVRIVSASPTSLMGVGPESWRSSDDSAHDARLSVRPEVLDTCWTPRRNLHPDEQPDDSGAETAGNQLAPSVADASSGRHKRSLQHAASHPSARDYQAGDASSSVSRRRLEWRNSHRNYRSTPTTSASRDAYYSALNYDTRRALRDYHQQHLQQPSFDSGAYAGRRMLPKRGGSMREANSSGKGDPAVSSVDPGCGGGVSGSNPALSSSGHVRCQMITSPATKRWRCHTVDCPCSNNVSAPAVPQDLMDSSAVLHRHSFPSSGDVSAGQSSGHGQRQHYHHHHHHHRDERAGHFSGARSKDVYYSGSYLDRSESLDWAGFQPIASPGASSVGGAASNVSGTGGNVRGGGDDDSSVIIDDDETAGAQMQASSGAPRITIRYNDPGSLESVNEENLFFCLDADNKKEFRQRLEKTIHAQYRQVWELRANLEEQTEFYEHPSSPEPELNSLSFAIPGELEMPLIGQTMSFDSNSNSEAPPDDDEDDDSSYTIPDSPAGNLLPSTSGLWKRQSYRSIAMNARLRRQTGAASLPMSAVQAQQQAQSSFDSVDTIETSSTDASRLEQMTTSFESSATDSTNGMETTVTHQQPSSSTAGHRLLSTRDDSGYRSIESSAVPQRLASKASPTFNPDDTTDRSDGESGVTCLRSSEQSCQCRGEVHDEKCERNKPIVFARCTRYGLKARSASTQNPPTSGASGWRHQGQRLQQHRSHQMLTRDYSIDERTDAIFREFSRCDPAYDGASGSGSRKDVRQSQGFNHRARWISQHQRHDPQHQHRFMSFQENAPEASDVLLQHCTLKE